VPELINEELSSITQFILAPFLFVGTDGEFSIPFQDTKTEEMILSEIAPHFHIVRKINSGNEHYLTVKGIKESSLNKFSQLVEEGKMNPIVEDLYSPRNRSWGGNFPSKEYRVNLDLINKSTKHEILNLWDFLKDTFLQANDGMAIVPSDWSFDESFKEKVAVQSFAGVCEEMIVTINCETNKIASIYIK